MLPDLIRRRAEPKDLRLYYRLILSYSDFKHAYRCAQYSMSVHGTPKTAGEDSLLLEALYCSMVVSYARPFNSRGTSRIGRIPPLGNGLLPSYSPEDIEVHKYVLVCRNKLLAHSDARAIDPYPFVAIDLPNDMVVPEKNDGLAPFIPEYTAKVLGIAEKAFHWCIEERRRLEPTIKHLLPRKAFDPTRRATTVNNA
jgi:hypothetical protein